MKLAAPRFRFPLRYLFIATTAFAICLAVGMAVKEYLSYRDLISYSEHWIAEIVTTGRHKDETLAELEVCRSILIVTPRLTEEDRSRLLDLVLLAKVRASALPEPDLDRNCYYSRIQEITSVETQETNVEGQ